MVGSCRTKPWRLWAARADLHFLDIEPIKLRDEPELSSAFPGPLPERGALQGALSLLWARLTLCPGGLWWGLGWVQLPLCSLGLWWDTESLESLKPPLSLPETSPQPACL